jgi:hypothetical protein
MKHNIFLYFIMLSGLIFSEFGFCEDSLWSALTGGRFDIFARYRYEFVEDGTPNIDNAYASTLRVAPGYRTGDYYDTSLYFQLEDVVRVGTDSYDDGLGPISGRAVVPDPEGLELKQAYVHYAGLPRTVFTIGRQYINHRPVPFNRFIGDQGWRQHFQAFDAARAVTLAIPDVIAEYTYTWNVNRTTRGWNRSPDARDYTMNSHWFNFQYSGLSIAKIEQYLYLLDYTSERAAKLSTVTAGLRIAGDRIIFPATRFLYAGEYAYQGDYANNPFAIDANYSMGQLGVSRVFDSPLESATLTFSYELLGGKGGVNAFQTPLATLHVFQGFADRFLVTPGDGVADMHSGLSLKILGSNLGVIYHNFKSDRGSYDYGSEWDIAFEKPIDQNFLIGIQYADYQANNNPRNLATNSLTGQAFDMRRFWTYVQFVY